MFIPFDQLRPEARLWVYQASRALTDPELQAVETALQTALTTWAAHGQPLLASGQVVQHRFLLVAADEAAGLPSGCSIDASVRTVQGIGQQLSLHGEPVDFMDRSVTYLDTAGDMQVLPLSAIKAAVADGRLTPDTLVFNTLVNTKAEYLNQWQVPARTTWLKRYFSQAVVC